MGIITNSNSPRWPNPPQTEEEITLAKAYFNGIQDALFEYRVRLHNYLKKCGSITADEITSISRDTHRAIENREPFYEYTINTIFNEGMAAWEERLNA